MKTTQTNLRGSVILQYFTSWLNLFFLIKIVEHFFILLLRKKNQLIYFRFIQIRYSTHVLWSIFSVTYSVLAKYITLFLIPFQSKNKFKKRLPLFNIFILDIFLFPSCFFQRWSQKCPF